LNANKLLASMTYWGKTFHSFTIYYSRKNFLPLHGKDMDLLKGVQRTAKKMIRDVGHLSHKERLKELGLFSLAKARLQGDLIVVFQFLK